MRRMRNEGPIYVPPVRERLQIVPIPEIRGVFPPDGDWAPDFTLKCDVPPDRRQQHEDNLRQVREIWADPTRQASLNLLALPLARRDDIHAKIVQLIEVKGDLLVMGEGVYRVKVAREQEIPHILALVREEMNNPIQ